MRKLPGIGPKTAQRLALYLLNAPAAEAEAIAQAIFGSPGEDISLFSLRQLHRCGTLRTLPGTMAGTVLWSAWWNRPEISSPSSVPRTSRVFITCCTGCFLLSTGLVSNLKIAELLQRVQSGIVKEVSVLAP